MRAPGLDHLWTAAPSTTAIFQPETLSDRPEPAQRLLRRAIAAGSPAASAVRLRMQGQIKLRQWCPFSAEEVIAWDRGFMWAATARVRGMPITGSDRLVRGEGMMRWKLLGLLTVMSARGPDITRSAAGRMMAESVWVPSVLCRPDVVWTALDRDRPRARVTVAGETADVTFAVEADGTLRSVSLLRWSNPDNTRFRYVEFGAVVEQQGTFGGFTIPTRLRVGYFIGTARFDSDGEFFRAEIATAAHR